MVYERKWSLECSDGTRDAWLTLLRLTHRQPGFLTLHEAPEWWLGVECTVLCVQSTVITEQGVKSRIVDSEATREGVRESRIQTQTPQYQGDLERRAEKAV